MNSQKWSLLTIGVVSLLTIFFAYQLKDIRFDFDIEKFFPVDHEETIFYENLRQNMGGDSDYIFIGINNKKGIFQKPFLTQIDSLYQQLKQIPNVEFVESPTRVKELKRTTFSSKLLESSFLHFKDPKRYQADSIRIYNHPYFENFIFSEDAKSIQLFLQHKELLTEPQCIELVNRINSVLKQFDFDEKHISGKCFGQTEYDRMIKKEVLIFVTVSTVLVAIFLFLSYRRFWGIWMPLNIVGLTILWTIGLLVFFDKPVYLVTNTIPTILLVVGISDCIHLLTNYLDRLPTTNKIRALKNAMQEVGIATILTTFTTAIGFMTMTTSNFSQLIDLGLFLTIGVLIALVLTYTLLPTFIYFHPPLEPNPTTKKDSFLTRRLNNLALLVFKNGNIILLLSGILFCLSLVGISYIKVDNYMLDDLKKNHPLIQDFSFFEKNFSGTRPLEIFVEVKDSNQNIFSVEVLKELEEVARYLEKTYEAKGIFTPSTIIKHANRISHFGKDDFFKIPNDVAQIEPIERKWNQYATKFRFGNLVAKDKKSARIIGKIPDIGSHAIRSKNNAFHAFLESEMPNSQLNYRVTGTMHLIDLNNQLLVRNVLRGLVIAVCCIGLLIALLFKSIRLIFITIVVNLLPLIIVAGLMGFLGIDLKLSTSIIFIISFGIAVDDSIHFLSCFKKEMQTQTVKKAIHKTYLTTGKAIVITSIILVGGFSSLCLSNFLGIFYIGLFVAFTLFVALIIDLTLLPILLLKFYK